MTTVVAALDPTAVAEEPEQLALVLARATGADLVLATVCPLIHLRSHVHARHYETLLRQEAERFLVERASALRAEAPDTTVATRTVGAASAARGLHRLARELDASLVVLGPSRRPAGRVLPGPMGSRFAHGAPCPVAVASAGGAIGGLSRIGVAFAPTDDGMRALQVGAELAGQTGATLHVIAVVAPLPWMDLVQPEFDGTSLQELYAGHIRYTLDNAIADLPMAIEPETELPNGDPVEILARASADLDLLVCGSRGHGPLGEVVLGSISHALLETVHCPVLVVPRAGG